MTKDDKKRYDRMINDIASRLMIDAHKEAFEVTENVPAYKNRTIFQRTSKTMTVAELIKELRKLPKDAELYYVKDWDEQDEEGRYLDLHRLDYVIDQTIFIETGMGFLEEHQVIMDFEREVARPKINNNLEWL